MERGSSKSCLDSQGLDNVRAYPQCDQIIYIIPKYLLLFPKIGILTKKLRRRSDTSTIREIASRLPISHRRPTTLCNPTVQDALIVVGGGSFGGLGGGWAGAAKVR